MLKKKDISEIQFYRPDYDAQKRVNLQITGAPTALDWRANSGNWVSPIKDQGSCGSCWAFSSVAVAESRTKIDLNSPSYSIDLSEQDVVSCNTGGGSCGGAWESVALAHMKNTGIVKESCFAYTQSNNICSTGCPKSNFN